MEAAARYAYEVYQKKSFSLAAEALFISQPALSAMVAKLERELGFQLFERTRGSAVTLTPRGRIYMDMLEDVRASEETMKARLEQFGRTSGRRLRVGTMMVSAQAIMPDALRRFHKTFPDDSVDLSLGNVGLHGVLHDKLYNGRLDLLLSYRAEPRFECRPLLSERRLIAMRRELAQSAGLIPYTLTREQILAHAYTEEQEFTELHLLKHVPFLTNGDVISRSYLSDLLGSHYTAASVSISDSRIAGMQYALLNEGLYAMPVLDTHLRSPLLCGDDLVYLLPKSTNPTLYVLWRKGERLSDLAERMLQALEDTCRSFSAF